MPAVVSDSQDSNSDWLDPVEYRVRKSFYGVTTDVLINDPPAGWGFDDSGYRLINLFKQIRAQARDSIIEILPRRGHLSPGLGMIDYPQHPMALCAAFITSSWDLQRTLPCVISWSRRLTSASNSA